MDVGLTGSVAFDQIMSFDGAFQDHIIPDKIHTLNVSFLVDGFEKRRGGCAANIAYACALHGLKAGILAAVGHDFEEYGAWLEDKGIELAALSVLPDMHTASCFITTDRVNNQITGFYPGAMSRAGELSIADFAAKASAPRLVVVSPNAPEAMTRYPGQCRSLGIPFVYDPGQQVIALDKDALADGVKGARALIVNDYELATIQKTLGARMDELLAAAAMVVVTYGAEGSRIHRAGAEPVHVPVAPIREVVDPTGCGDAYRGGFIHGLLNEAAPEVCGRLGALTASYCIEVKGTSDYGFTAEAFAARYKEAFGEDAPRF